MTLDMSIILTNPVETGPHEKKTMDCDFCGLVSPGSGGFRLMGDLPVGLSTYLASSYRRH